MLYKYMGKEVEVVRFSNNDTAQLADGTWVASALLHKINTPGIVDHDAEQASQQRAKKSGNN